MLFCCFVAFDGPGPGSYEIKSDIGSGVATSIRGRQRVRASEYYVIMYNVHSNEQRANEQALQYQTVIFAYISA